MSKRDYYEVLGVTKTVTEVELKVAFRKLAMVHHPDRNPGNKESEIAFKEVNEAYQCLSDGQKRAAYDRFGHAAFQQGGQGGPGFGNEFGDFMSDIFENFFGDGRGQPGAGAGRGRGGAPGRERGADLRFNLEISLEEAFSGKTEAIKIPTSIACEPCSGTGAKPGSKARPCPTCGGYGRVRAAQGFFAIERTCPNCHGRGEVIDDPCPSCSGAGRVTRERNLSINVPAGVDDGLRIRLAGEGESGLRGGPSGDLYVFLSIAPHTFFQRDGADLFCRVPISMVTAALSGEITVPVIDGTQTQVRIPAGTQAGKQFRIKGKGMPVLRSREVGDLYIQVSVETPQNLTKRQRELLQEFDQSASAENHPESAGFFSKVKDFFVAGAGRS
ncbi:molecular chaperone DnaJ [Methylobacterium haplocladii]|uniref:Chaperone protein DnaJ n=1 Tax=Methylobacterium haplocladii TaxID=1176176 RepID=A0A512IMC4_9HYPH|nr:molecular chaperone DnaJ [Methylobacterium haplocladii]GEO98867.1 chaperone protein DnaJ [Methylobacterium haplocladii]GJD85116.1 Chaperone protein DnaJ [Methylobacterium haplocladii]GLS61055.1 chaperone protein DnaJ [Methylobacterium haplocladii]